MRVIAIALCLALGACAHRGERIVTRDVLIEKPVPCSVKMPETPDFPDTDEAIKAAPNVYERGKLFVAGRQLRIAYEAELRAALKACQ